MVAGYFNLFYFRTCKNKITSWAENLGKRARTINKSSTAKHIDLRCNIKSDLYFNLFSNVNFSFHLTASWEREPAEHLINVQTWAWKILCFMSIHLALWLVHCALKWGSMGIHLGDFHGLEEQFPQDKPLGIQVNLRGVKWKVASI